MVFEIPYNMNRQHIYSFLFCFLVIFSEKSEVLLEKGNTKSLTHVSLRTLYNNLKENEICLLKKM
jgi:hypothetical protein